MRPLVAVLLTACSLAVQAQVPHVIGTWTLNADASRLPGPAPLSQVTVDAQGRPSFLQFAARPDGNDYPEFDATTAARYLIDKTPPTRTYSETPIDSHTVVWADKEDGRVIASGKKWVSTDGQTLSYTITKRGGEDVDYLIVFDRTGP